PALPERVAQDDPRRSRVQAIVNLQPQTDQQPGKTREPQQQRSRSEFQREVALQVQPGACFVGGPKSQGGQNNVRQPEQNSCFAIALVQHFVHRISWRCSLQFFTFVGNKTAEQIVTLSTVALCPIVMKSANCMLALVLLWGASAVEAAQAPASN